MGLDEHLQMSTAAGIIDKYKGASNYLNDRPGPAQAVRVLVCHIKSKMECLDLATLINEDVPRIEVDGKTKATHVVTGITYGAEAYCVICQELKGEKIDRDALEEAEENLSGIISKMENALADSQELGEFKEQFDREEKQFVNKLKCRLYVDPSSAVKECGVFDAYKHCLKLIEQMKSDVGKNKAAPISVQLCPLKVVVGQNDGLLFEYRDVDGDLVSRCCRLWAELEQIGARADALKKGGRPFGTAMKKYQELVRKSLKTAVVKARESDDDDDEVERVVNIAKSHALFKPSRLDRWIRYKQAEGEMAGKMTNLTGITFLASQKQVEKELAESFNKKHALVFHVPPLDERANEILNDLTDYVENFTKLISMEREDEDETDEEEEFLFPFDPSSRVLEENDGMPWHMIQRKRNQVLAQIRGFVDHVANNKHLENKVQFLITFNEAGKRFACHYSVYEAEKLLEGNQLPVPPAGLRLELGNQNSKKFSIRVLWDYEDLGYPCLFLIEYRLKDSSDSWKQQKTSKPGEYQTAINMQRESALEIRVAADSCIGRSEFSQIIDTESALDGEESDGDYTIEKRAVRQQHKPTEAAKPTIDWTVRQQQAEATRAGNPKPARSTTSDSSVASRATYLSPPTGLEIDLVTQSTAEVSWLKLGAGRTRITYRVRYWEDGRDNAPEELEVYDETGCRIENLQPETTYCVEIVAVSSDGQQMSVPSEILSLTTSNRRDRFAEMIVKRCKKIKNQNGLDLYAVPLTKTAGKGTTAERFVFGKADGKKSGQQNGRMQHRTILVMGATGSGKTTLINGMINYIFNVEWDDPYRFQLIQEQMVGRSQIDSQTSKITAYEIHHSEGFRIPYSLTIVDTPGYGDTKGLDRDQEITEMVRQFFEDKNGIQELDVVGFVAQASLPRLTPTQVYIFDSVLSIFGNDVKENINFLLTFADSQIPPVLSAIKQAGLPYPTDEDGNPVNHKFNNSGFFCSNRESSGASNTVDKFNRFFWRMGMENFDKFFNVLATMKTKSLSLTKQVLEERKRLEATVDGLQPLIKIGLSKMEEMRKTKQMITNSQAQIEANENVEFEVEVTVAQKREIPAGQYLTNCNKCYITCHNPCAYKNDDDKVNCWAMDFSQPAATRPCRICPEKCIWNMHANQPYSWEYVKQKQTTSSDAIKEKYEKELKRKLTAQDLIKVLQQDIDNNNQKVLSLVNIVSNCIQRLDEIALRPNPFSTPQYIDLIIDAEQQEKKTGFKERIESLKKLRQMAVITSKIKKQENLLTLDGNEDVDDQQGEKYDEEYDDDDYDGASLTSAATFRQKFNNSFVRN